MVFAVAVAGSAVPVFDVTKLYIIVPSIQRDLGAGPFATQLLVAGYLLVFGLALVPAGRYGDLRSRKGVFLFGVGLFAAASLVAALAPSAALLVVARMAQALGGAFILPQTLGVVQSTFTGADRARALGIMSAVFGLCTTAAPGIAGLLVGLFGDSLGWRASFLANVPIALVVFAVALRRFPVTVRAADASRNLDPIGTALLALALGCALAPFVLTGQDPDVPMRWWVLLLLPVLVVAFARWERRYAASGRVPVIDPELFRIPSFRNGVVITTLYFGAIPGVLYLASLFLQSALGLSALQTGLVAIASASGYAVGAFSAGRLAQRLGRSFGVIALGVFALGIAVFLLVAETSTPAFIPVLVVVPMVVAGLGGGSFAPTTQTLTFAEVPPPQAGLAGSIQLVAQRVGTAIGLAGVTAIFAAFRPEQGEDLLRAGRGALGWSVGMMLVFVLAAAVLVLAERRRTEPNPS